MSTRQLSDLGRVRLALRRPLLPLRLEEFHVLNCAGCRVVQWPSGVVIVYCPAHALQRARKASPDDQSREA